MGGTDTWETVTKAQSASLLSVTHGSPTFPKGPFGASGRTKGRYDRSASPRGVPSALIGQQQASLFWFLRLNNASHPTAAQRCDVIQQKPIDHTVIFPSLHKTAALL